MLTSVPIQGQQRTLTLIKPHSKAVLQEALRSDAEFLAKSNIMDYSCVSSLEDRDTKLTDNVLGCSSVWILPGNRLHVGWLILLVRTSRFPLAPLLICIIPIGSYTFAKTLEYKAKQGLNSGKEVTVIPPAEYQERFVNALDGYFVACPGTCSHSLGSLRPGLTTALQTNGPNL